MGRDSSVGIATCYRPEIDSGWGEIFPHLEAHPAFCAMGTGSLSQGSKWPDRGVDHPPHIAPRLKKE